MIYFKDFFLLNHEKACSNFKSYRDLKKLLVTLLDTIQKHDIELQNQSRHHQGRYWDQSEMENVYTVLKERRLS